MGKIKVTAGKALEVVRAVNYVLAPLEERLWKYEQATKFIRSKVTRKLEKAPHDQINRKPKASVVVPALEAVALTEGDPDLEELFANLVASAMRPKTEAPFDTLHHGLRDSDLNCAIGTGALGVEDDPNLVIDQIVSVVGKQ